MAGRTLKGFQPRIQLGHGLRRKKTRCIRRPAEGEGGILIPERLKRQTENKQDNEPRKPEAHGTPDQNLTLGAVSAPAWALK